MLRRPLLSASHLDKVLQLTKGTPSCRGAILEQFAVRVDESCPLLSDSHAKVIEGVNKRESQSSS
eukprot:3044574-Pleurochrysis_carterae.AAC.1